MPENYDIIPKAPVAPSMLPRATALTLEDILVLTHPGNPIGQKSRSLTIAVLAAFLGNKHFSSIVLEGTGGKELTLSGDGVTYVIPPGSGETDQFEFEVSDDKNVTIKMSGPDGVRVVTLTPTSVEVKNTQAGLEHKTTIGNTGITVLSQSRDGANIVESTSELTYGSLKSQLLKIKDGDQGDYVTFETPLNRSYIEETSTPKWIKRFGTDARFPTLTLPCSPLTQTESTSYKDEWSTFGNETGISDISYGRAWDHQNANGVMCFRNVRDSGNILYTGRAML